jgi:hypothetical protein
MEVQIWQLIQRPITGLKRARVSLRWKTQTPRRSTRLFLIPARSSPVFSLLKRAEDGDKHLALHCRTAEPPRLFDFFRSFVPRGLAHGKRSVPSFRSSTNTFTCRLCANHDAAVLPPASDATRPFSLPTMLRTPLFPGLFTPGQSEALQCPRFSPLPRCSFEPVLPDLCQPRRLPLMTIHPCGICLLQLSFGLCAHGASRSANWFVFRS